jgi:hypothetical protein
MNDPAEDTPLSPFLTLTVAKTRSFSVRSSNALRTAWSKAQLPLWLSCWR